MNQFAKKKMLSIGNFLSGKNYNTEKLQQLKSYRLIYFNLDSEK